MLPLLSIPWTKKYIVFSDSVVNPGTLTSFLSTIHHSRLIFKICFLTTTLQAFYMIHFALWHIISFTWLTARLWLSNWKFTASSLQSTAQTLNHLNREKECCLNTFWKNKEINLIIITRFRYFMMIYHENHSINRTKSVTLNYST